jgi:hypothetical protein
MGVAELSGLCMADPESLAGGRVDNGNDARHLRGRQLLLHLSELLLLRREHIVLLLLQKGHVSVCTVELELLHCGPQVHHLLL